MKMLVFTYVEIKRFGLEFKKFIFNKPHIIVERMIIEEKIRQTYNFYIGEHLPA